MLILSTRLDKVFVEDPHISSRAGYLLLRELLINKRHLYCICVSEFVYLKFSMTVGEPITKKLKKLVVIQIYSGYITLVLNRVYKNKKENEG